MKRIIIAVSFVIALSAFTTTKKVFFAPLQSKKQCGYVAQSTCSSMMYMWLDMQIAQSELFQEESYRIYQNEDTGLWCWEVTYRILPPVNQ